LVEILEKLEIPWCMIDGLAVNHWTAEPLATADIDVDVMIAVERVEDAVAALTAAGFQAKRFEWSINLKGASHVSIQISTEDIYREFPSRSIAADVHGISMRVASLEDTLAGKIAAWSDKNATTEQAAEGFARRDAVGGGSSGVATSPAARA
jgi:hypothetical protein